jgi:hypothetical protein
MIGPASENRGFKSLSPSLRIGTAFAFLPLRPKEDFMTRSQVVWMAAGSAGLFLIAAQAMGMLFGPGFPTLVTPFPFVFVFLYFNGVPALVLAMGVLVFPLLTFNLVLRFGEDARVLLSTLYLAALAASLWAFWTRWMEALIFEGPVYTWGTMLLSLLFATAIGAQLYLDRRRPSEGRLFAVTFFLYFWLYTYAVPYLGEVP